MLSTQRSRHFRSLTSAPERPMPKLDANRSGKLELEDEDLLEEQDKKLP